MLKFLALAAVMMSAALAVGEEKPGEVLLKDIWALNMPGTENVRKLESRADAAPRERIDKAFIESIRASLQNRERDNRRGFAVSGVGSQALRSAHAVLVLQQKPPTEVAGDISLVFYAFSGPRIQLRKIEREGNVITIKWRFVSSGELMARDTLALIPFFGLPTGQYQVRFERQPSVARDKLVVPVAGESAEKMVKTFLCTPFHFKVL